MTTTDITGALTLDAIPSLIAFNAYYAAWTQVIGGVDMALQMAKQKETALNKQQVEVLTDTVRCLIGPPGCGATFKAKSNTGITTNYAVNQRLKRVCEKLSIDNVSTHTMHRTFITHLAKMGVSIDIRNRLTNHADLGLPLFTRKQSFASADF